MPNSEAESEGTLKAALSDMPEIVATLDELVAQAQELDMGYGP